MEVGDIQVDEECMRVDYDYMRVENVQFVVVDDEKRNENECEEEPEEVVLTVMHYSEKGDYKVPEAKGDVQKNEDYYKKKTEIYKVKDVEKYQVDYMRDNMDWMECLVRNIRKRKDEHFWEQDGIKYLN